MNKKIIIIILIIILTGVSALLIIRLFNNDTEEENVKLNENNYIEHKIIVDFEIEDIEELKLAKELLLRGRYGNIPIEELLEKRIGSTDATSAKKEMVLVLLVQKDESLPVIREKLKVLEKDDLYFLLRLIQTDLRWPEVLPEILSIINTPGHSESIYIEAIRVTAIFQNKDALPMLRDLVINANDHTVQSTALSILPLLGEKEDIDILRPLLKDESLFVRIKSALALAWLGNNEGEEVALEISHNENFGLRFRAAEALAAIGTEKSLNRLEEMILDDPSSTVREHSKEYKIISELDKLTKQEAVKLIEKRYFEGGFSWTDFSYLNRYLSYEGSHLLKELLSETTMQEIAIESLLKVYYGAVSFPRK